MSKAELKDDKKSTGKPTAGVSKASKTTDWKSRIHKIVNEDIPYHGQKTLRDLEEEDGEKKK